MDTACNASRHFVKLTAIAVMVLASAWYAFAPVFVLAQEAAPAEQTCGANSNQPKCNALCWKKEQCDKEKGLWEQNDESGKECGGSPWGYCYPPNREVTLQVPIVGDIQKVADMGKYIKAVYLFALGIGGLVGAIVLIHAGFLWLVSGGNTGTIERAKKHIQDAAIGLLLLFGSYTILSAINPDLVRLHVPKAQLLRNIALEFEPKKEGKVGGECNVADDRSKNECEAACDGCKCIEFDNGMVTLAQWVSWGAVAAAASTIFAGTAVAQLGVKALGWGGKSVKFVASKLFGLCTTGLPVAAICAYGAGATVDDVIAKLTGKGVCIPPASNQEKGAMCAFNANCKSGKCIGGSTEEHLGFIGFCGDGTEGSPCEADKDCVGIIPEGQLVCAKGPLDTKWCTTEINRQKGSPCEAVKEGDEVKSKCAAGLGCGVVDEAVWTLSTKEGIGWCVDARIAAGGSSQYIGDPCGNGCPGADRFQELGYTLQCRAQPGKAERCTQACNVDDDCKAACPPDQQCNCSYQQCDVGARVAAAPAQVEILQNGGSGCDNQAARRCADGLICTADAILYRDGAAVLGPAHVCTNKQLGSLCSSDEECNSNHCESAGAFPNGDPELKCV